MPTYKVGFPYIVVEAPDERAARSFYHVAAGDWVAYGLRATATEVGEVAQYIVDAEGYEIEEAQASPPPLHECTPSEKHSGLCAECGEPLEYPVKRESEEV
jgi:hypothetical protein